MADDLNEKMEPEISEAAEAVEEVAKEETAVVEAAEEKAIDAGEAVAAAAVTASAAGKEAAKEATKEADAAAKAAKKAEEQAAKEAAKKQAAADKEAEKAKAKRQKRAAQQALIDACPPQYRPVSTSKYFWLAFLSAIPFVGFIATIFLSIAGRNRNVKNFEKAILAYYIIAIVIALIALIVIGVALPAEIRSNVLTGLREIVGSVNIG